MRRGAPFHAPGEPFRQRPELRRVRLMLRGLLDRIRRGLVAALTNLSVLKICMGALDEAEAAWYGAETLRVAVL